MTASDAPTNDGIPKQDSETFTAIVIADSVAAQSTENGTVSADENVTLSWSAVVGQAYVVQCKDSVEADWSDLTTVTADSEDESIEVTNGGAERFYRIVEAANGASGE